MKTLLPILLAAGAIAAPAAAQNAISPGYWELTNQIISPLPSKKVEMRCIKPADVAKFMQGPSNHIYKCSYPTREIGGGKIRLAGTCASKDRSFPITGEGVFTSDTMRVDARVGLKLGGLTVPGHARTVAKRIGECPAETASAGR
jgi:hypothetical protein